MTDQQQPKTCTCGECRHFNPMDMVRGDCVYPIPPDLPSSLRVAHVYESDGFDCPCFDPKEADNEPATDR